MNGKSNSESNVIEKSSVSQGGASSSELYDVAYFDPLQANAQQLTASAGLTNVRPNQSTITSQSSTTDRSHQALQQKMEQPTAAYNPLQSMPQHVTQQTDTLKHPYMTLNPNNNPLQFQPIATTAAPNPTTVVSHAPIMGQGFYLPGSTIPLATTNFPAQVFPATTQQLNGLIQQPQSHQLLHMNPSTGKRNARGDLQQQEPRKKHRGLQSSITSVVSTGSSGMQFKSLEVEVDVSAMTHGERRRHERNLREQQRSSKITQQVKELRDLLTDSNVPFKPNKYSILVNVVDYIKQLQGRAIMLDAEHKKLITTIRRTNEIMQSGNPPSSADETDATNLTGNISSDPGSESEMIFVQGLNYKSVFQQSPAALGVAALDGILLNCNVEFELLLGFPRESLVNNNLFNLVQNHEEMYRVMAKMLGPTDQSSLGLGQDNLSSSPATPVFWTGSVVTKRDVKLVMNLTLTAGNDGAPKFFTCSVTKSLR